MVSGVYPKMCKQLFSDLRDSFIKKDKAYSHFVFAQKLLEVISNNSDCLLFRITIGTR